MDVLSRLMRLVKRNPQGFPDPLFFRKSCSLWK